MINATTFAGTPLSCAHDEYVRLNVNHVTRGRSPASHAGQTHRVKTLFGEIGLPDTAQKISLWAAVLFVRAFHAARSVPSSDRRNSVDFAGAPVPIVDHSGVWVA